MQYKTGTVNLENGSNTVTGNSTVFQNNVRVGDSFKVYGENAVYQILAVDPVLQQLTIAPVYAGASVLGTRYQIMRDRTQNLGLAEINPGDEDWPYWLTQEVIRKLDVTFAHPRLADLEDVYVGPTEPTDPIIQFWINTSGV